MTINIVNLLGFNKTFFQFIVGVKQSLYLNVSITAVRPGCEQVLYVRGVPWL